MPSSCGLSLGHGDWGAEMAFRDVLNESQEGGGFLGTPTLSSHQRWGTPEKGCVTLAEAVPEAEGNFQRGAPAVKGCVQQLGEEGTPGHLSFRSNRLGVSITAVPLTSRDTLDKSSSRSPIYPNKGAKARGCIRGLG